MVLKKIFEKLGSITIDTSKKVEEGVKAPAAKLASIRPLFTGRRDFRETIKRRSTSMIMERMRMTPEEVEVFKELIEADKRREEEKKESEKKYTEASLEELLKEEEKKFDPKILLMLGTVSGLILLLITITLGLGLDIGLILMFAVTSLSVILTVAPKLQKGRKSSEASRQLPFALRQMATELRAGLGLHDTMRSVALSGYGALSEEFARTLEEIKYGESTENALREMCNRVDSEGLDRAVYQITRTLESGGDLAKTLNIIAEDIAYEMRMKLRDYSQKLNSFTMIYMFIAILGPVIFLVMLLAAATIMEGSVLPPIAILLLYLLLFPMIVGFMAFMVKRLEPKL
ncbi:MAG TPA: type II secretion system F family protein [Methanothermobacter sp.]|jgi:flagellar protein FlaJ|uniref:Type II secretion protein F n=1 Tax=Methanothermobacter tenebrarum TaxID=680118 RepID=A0ABN6PCV3_9EURY|nr:type II secretion system F family protein [Methanothermobacter tenebrarum]MDD3455196.1 type II secretion system F family protein [Methanobacteriales archaeon]MDX9692790.1 type II secretion system F family protein [Methanothermobacter sp.]BDH80066.1 type II secretion protein F [Methanothermobacter tenebrarum]HHW16382.1 type II secretion system F family protein [Methanothermobacter sp.]